MGARRDIETIMVIGSGPIVIGQACEFDYSGTQACRVLAQEGYRVVLANSNPATIMTDPAFADRTYIEPLSAPVLEAICERERPDALLATLGGQTALNLAMELANSGVLDEMGIEMIGASPDAIRTAEDRERFKEAMREIGLDVPPSGRAKSLDQAWALAAEIGFPLMIRPSFILGGAGTGIALGEADFSKMAPIALAASPIGEILVERSIAGWKEYELEVMRDRADNAVVVCSIENFDAMGVHTGDSITVAPAQTLSDIEYQEMRDEAFACIRRIGVETGGSNIQFAVNPTDGHRVVIEMNPRVSRSSALASKATGFPIAKIAARLAVGYTLDEIPNDITKRTPASFEPTIDYVVTKVPRWAFEKFPSSPGVLGTKMQSVGEVMAIGRTFPESLQKAMRSLENGQIGLGAGPREAALTELSDAELEKAVARPTSERPFHMAEALRRGFGAEAVSELSGVDPWFVDNLEAIVAERRRIEGLAKSLGDIDRLDGAEWRRIKQMGFSDAQVAYLFGTSAAAARDSREKAGVMPTFKTVDTCAAEFDAETPYHYSTWEEEDEVAPSTRPRVVILGSGPNRIGQGIEFDYCCVHASFALREAGFETVMVNCNPETVSTDYDTSDRLYFEPLFPEDVAGVLDSEAKAGPIAGVIVSLGGQTPLKLASGLDPALVLGTKPASIDLAEDRYRWSELCTRLGIPQPLGATVRSVAEAEEAASKIGYPVLVRPSYVLGGRAMEIVYDSDGLRQAMEAMGAQDSLAGEGGLAAERPVLVDRFLEDAVEVDVDALRDSSGEILIGGVMEHVEEAGVHSGDSACVLPPPTLSPGIVETIVSYTRSIADALEVVGLLNVQYAVKDGVVYVIEANPRASRTVPFVAKATGVPLAKMAARLSVGHSLAMLASEGVYDPSSTWDQGGIETVSVKEAVLPFSRFPGSDALLGPEMRSTGEVMGIDDSFELAFAKSQMAAGTPLPDSGSVLISLADRDKEAGVEVASLLAQLGFDLVATSGTAERLVKAGLEVAAVVAKVGDESTEGNLDAAAVIASGQVDMVINTPRGRGPRADGAHIRTAAAQTQIPCLTTLPAARAAAAGIAAWRGHALSVRSLQEVHAGRGGRARP